MKWVAVSLGWLGALLGVFVGLVERGGLIGPALHQSKLLSSMTLLASGIVMVGSVVILVRPRWGALLYILALLGGVFGAGTMWELPGAFIFIGLIVLLMHSRGIQDL